MAGEAISLSKMKNSKRILFVHQFLAMGDALLLTPIYKVIKDNLRGAEIFVLTNEYSAPFVRSIPYVDHVYPLEHVFKKGAFRLENLLRLCIFFIRNRVDTIVLRGDKRFPQRAIYLASKLCLLRIISLERYLEEEVIASRHIVDSYLTLLEKMGFYVKERRHLYIGITDADKMEAKRFLKVKNGKLAGIAPVSNIKIKNWTPEKTAELITRLKSMSYDVILFCADEEFSGKVRGLVGDSRLTVIGRVDFHLLMGLVSLCEIFIGVDTGPTHLAAAVGAPTIGLYGPTSGIIAGPYNEKSSYIQSSIDCPYYNPLALFSPREKPLECYQEGNCKLPLINCVDVITVDEVLEEIRRHDG